MLINYLCIIPTDDYVNLLRSPSPITPITAEGTKVKLLPSSCTTWHGHDPVRSCEWRVHTTS